MDPDQASSHADGDAGKGPHSVLRCVVEAEHAAADVMRRVYLHQRLRHGAERQVEDSCRKQQQSASG